MVKYNKSYKNNGQVLLTYHVKDSVALDGINDFVGDSKFVTAPGHKKIILTLHGWQIVNLGDYIVHLFATEDMTTEIATDDNRVYTKSGFLIIEGPIFEKHFDPVSEALQ